MEAETRMENGVESDPRAEVEALRRDVAEWIRAYGPIPAMRCSRARGSGGPLPRPYWGTVPYMIRLTARDGVPAAYARGSADMQRCSLRLAQQDTERAAERAGAIVIDSLGRLDLADLRRCADWIAAWRARHLDALTPRE